MSAKRWITLLASTVLVALVLVNAPATLAASEPSHLSPELRPVDLTTGPQLPPDFEPQVPEGTAGRRGVNVRTGPSTRYQRIGYLAPGAVARITGRFADWWRIDYEGGEGWIYGGIVAATRPEQVPAVELDLPIVAPSPPVVPPPAAPHEIAEQRWIDIDLSEQRLTAYENGEPVHSYPVSTGLPRTPTVEGQFRIWIKLRYDDMSGPDYDLKDVPYVMYFYQGYGLHAATWHNNFGHPMSHGCVNQTVEDAAWLFEFAEVGTLVNVHD
ncbi:MAG: L,D-transpeptidase family protein [Anaerolineales bacterium]